MFCMNQERDGGPRSGWSTKVQTRIGNNVSHLQRQRRSEKRISPADTIVCLKHSVSVTIGWASPTSSLKGCVKVVVSVNGPTG
jgi:hypothetical protein